MAEDAIPDDIMAMAVVAVDEAALECQRRKFMFGFPTAHGKEVLDEYIARALMAERLAAESRGRQKQREEDARIAEAYSAQFSPDHSEPTLVYAKHSILIATAIRNQGQPT